METNFDPNGKAPTPYLLFKAHRVNITPLFSPVLPSCIPGPDLRPLLIACSTPQFSGGSSAHPPPPVTSSLEIGVQPRTVLTTGAPPNAHSCV